MKKMKGVFAAVAVMGCGVFNVNAQDVPLKEVEYFAGNPSAYSQACIDAVNEGKTYRELEMSHPKYRTDQRISCNGKTLKAFVDEQYQYRKKLALAEQEKVSVVAADDSFASELCQSAAKSNKAFKRALKSRGLRFSRVSHLECNGVPVAQFAKSNGNPKFKF